jgi:hypothetical protein
MNPIRPIGALFLLTVLAAGCAKKEDADAGTTAPAASSTPPPSSEAPPSTGAPAKPTKVTVKGAELTVTGKKDADGAPQYTIKNTGTKPIESYVVQVVVNGPAGERIAGGNSSVSPNNPIAPGASLDSRSTFTESKKPGTKTDFHLWTIRYGDNTYWEDPTLLDERPVGGKAAPKKK